MLPHLRQPMLESMRAPEGVLAHEQSVGEQIGSFLGESFDGAQPADLPTLPTEGPVLTSVSPCKRERYSPSPICSATIKSVRPPDPHSAEPSDVGSKFTAQDCLLSLNEKTDDDQTSPQILPSNTAPGEKHVSNHLFAREGRSVLYVPLPVPDVEEVEFFATEDAILSGSDLGEPPVAACEHQPILEDCFMVDDKPTAGKDIDQDDQLIAVGIPGTQEFIIDMAMPAADEGIASSQTNSPSAVEDLVGVTISDLPHGLLACKTDAQSIEEVHPLVTKKVGRPESLEFIPQSVIRRYPSTPMVSAGRCFRHRTFSSERVQQVPPSPPVFIDESEVLLQETRERANYPVLEGPWVTSFLTPTRRSMEEQSYAAKNISAKLLEQESTSLPTIHVLQKHPTHRRRLGVLARAALRDRRSAARRRMDNGNDGSSTSGSDSDTDSDSQYSSESSEYENMLPHMLGTDLIAAIDANSESELNLFGPKRTKPTPLNVYEDFLISEDSAADISVVMQVSSHDNASDGEVGAPVTFRSLTYEDIQQWATGVVQKCVRQVYRNRVATEPSSPSQASDVCAERPSGSGASQCPLSGLHCKLGVVASAKHPAPRTKESPTSHSPAPNPPTRKPLRVRSLRDIPEFVPRQRHGTTNTGRVEDARRTGTKPTTDTTRDAITRVITRMEHQAGFRARQWLMGMEKRMVNTAGGRQGALRCA